MMIGQTYDVIVVGAGHAGCEAAVASARMGAKTCLVTMDMNKIAQMSCNPAVGGVAKGQIVREIDALGGMMGRVADECTIQFRMLNRSKGPAVWSPRAQCDRQKYILTWRHILENTDNLHIWQDEVCEVLTSKTESRVQSPESRVGITGVRTIWGAELHARCVIITAGTFLNGLMHIGRKQVEGGRIAEPAAKGLTESLTALGLRQGRMKTGTPVRIDKRSVDFSLMERQDGDEEERGFSFFRYESLELRAESLEQRAEGSRVQGFKGSTAQNHLGLGLRALGLREKSQSQSQKLPCWLCMTNKEVHEVLKSGLDDSPLYNGQIQSIGPRYCPSIETKLHTFPDKEFHQLFLEPEGETTNEMYLNGFSSSLPMDVQIEALRKIPCFRNLVVYRPGYAIEYDFFDPTQLNHTLESKLVDGLYMAGQVNGTTGYEEAAGQGLMAGVNAALKCRGKEPFVLRRNEAYIGVLIDDLVTKGVDEPYRMFTSRAEYRILLRQDNADMRLTEKGYELGLATKERYEQMIEKRRLIDEIIDFAEHFSIKANLINDSLERIGTTPLERGCKLIDLLSRPLVTIENMREAIKSFDDFIESRVQSPESRVDLNEVLEEAEILIKYRGYIEREEMVAEKMLRLENIKIRGKFDYEQMTQISIEARQKLSQINPETLAQASRIPGVSPSDINAMLVLMGR